MFTMTIFIIIARDRELGEYLFLQFACPADNRS